MSASTFHVVSRIEHLHPHEGAYATLAREHFSIVRDSDGKIVRDSLCPSIVDAYCDHMNTCSAAGEWTPFNAH